MSVVSSSTADTNLGLFIEFPKSKCIGSRVLQDFGSGSGKSEIRPFFGNLVRSPASAKFLAGFGYSFVSAKHFS